MPLPQKPGLLPERRLPLVCCLPRAPTNSLSRLALASRARRRAWRPASPRRGGFLWALALRHAHSRRGACLSAARLPQVQGGGRPALRGATHSCESSTGRRRRKSPRSRRSPDSSCAPTMPTPPWEQEKTGSTPQLLRQRSRRLRGAKAAGLLHILRSSTAALPRLCYMPRVSFRCPQEMRAPTGWALLQRACAQIDASPLCCAARRRCSCRPLGPLRRRPRLRLGPVRSRPRPTPPLPLRRQHVFPCVRLFPFLYANIHLSRLLILDC